jgi:hypothetical protein
MLQCYFSRPAKLTNMHFRVSYTRLFAVLLLTVQHKFVITVGMLPIQTVLTLSIYVRHVLYNILW